MLYIKDSLHKPRYGYTAYMDEIFIEEKKYISSKQAAKITGYAKDYIGQLCREGRVPAQLVGRSWYVLESAIQDHRFGTPIQTDTAAAETVSPVQSILPPTWESPRYEPSPSETLPSISHVEIANEQENISVHSQQHIQDSWQAWFDLIEKETKFIVAESKQEKDRGKQEPEQEQKQENNVINVPIHRQKQFSTVSQGKRWNRRIAIKAIRITGVLLAAIMVVIAVLGSGYFDEYIISNSQVRSISGVLMYNK